MKTRNKKYLINRRLKAVKTLILSKSLRKEALQIIVAFLYKKSLKQPVPSTPLQELIKKNTICHLFPASLEDGNLSTKEIIAISSLIQTNSPKNLLEIGTFNGLTTLHMALNTSQEAKVHTLDLSTLEDYPKDALDPEDIKYICHNSKNNKHYQDTLYNHKIIEHEGNSLTYPFSNFIQEDIKIDFIFIDGGHSYQVVKNDTEKSLKILKENGILIWHDYTPNCPGVFTYLNELSKTHPILHIDKTTLVYFKAPKINYD
ncbi:MAG: class I SAM-dependent methyltransferase [Chlamydiota bacterium]